MKYNKDYLNKKNYKFKNEIFIKEVENNFNNYYEFDFKKNQELFNNSIDTTFKDLDKIFSKYFDETFFDLENSKTNNTKRKVHQKNNSSFENEISHEYSPNTTHSLSFKQNKKIDLIINSNMDRASYLKIDDEEFKISFPDFILNSINQAEKFSLEIYCNQNYENIEILRKSKKLLNLSKELSQFGIDLSKLFFMKIKTENLSLLESQDLLIPVICCNEDKIKKSNNMIHIESEGFLKLSKYVKNYEFDMSTKKKSVSFFTKLSNWILPKNNQEVKIDKRIPLLLENIDKVFKDEEKFLLANPQDHITTNGSNNIFESISGLINGKVQLDTFVNDITSQVRKKMKI